ncbi:hypothetical protein C8F04DRAFT_1398642 [Mycena alexandri]|uniref:Uncharacterized protein n=1 Tax=Mycena alexandri TaxID=1745969 RepID=A0AAD6WZ54_9AGAR|nr:hypothetical protein C8F04DRAFT_1398642 [Mycena alexandri]
MGGHPLFPDNEIHGTNTGIVQPTNYTENEEEQRKKAVVDAAAGRKFGRVVVDLTVSSAGVWANVGPVLTFAQAVNIGKQFHGKAADNIASAF